MIRRQSGLTILTVLLLAACSSDGRTVLTVYSPHGKDLLAAYETEFEKANPTIDVQWMDMGSQEVLDRLPLQLRAVLVLADLEEMTMAKIAEMLDLPPGTVASRLRRARELFVAEARAARIALEGEGS